MEEENLQALEATARSTEGAGVDPKARIEALNQLAWALRASDLSRAHGLAHEARALAIEHGDKLGQARAARTLGMTILGTEQMATLLGFAEEAKALFDEVGDGPGRAASRDFLSSIYEYSGEFSLALELAVDALSIARTLPDPARRGYALSSVGGILAATGQVDAGLERLLEALQIFEQAQNLEGVGTICTRLCKIFQSAGRSDEARTYAERCRAVAEQTQSDWGLATALTVLAELEIERGAPGEAEGLYRLALRKLTTESTRNLLGSSIQVALGRLLITQGALPEAARVLKDALARVEGDGVSTLTERTIHEALAELCEVRGELAQAIVHLRKSQALQEQLAQRDAKRKLAQAEARAAMEAAKKDAEIHKLRFVELHEMQSKLLEAERTALLSKVAAGTAHELNTPLGVLKSNSQLAATATSRLLELVQSADAPSAQAERLARVLESCRETTEQALERLGAVTQRFKLFSQLDRAAVQRFDLGEGLRSAMALLEPGLSPEIRLEPRFVQLPAMEGWPRELNQAFLTVLENAVQAIDGPGQVEVRTELGEGELRVAIQDSGRGLSPEQAAHLFDMAWSEGGARSKMRMGLCAAQFTTQKHGGTIRVESALGQGTTVTFAFPMPN